MLDANRTKVAIALLQEPYVGGTRSMKSYGSARIFQNSHNGDGTIKAAIAVFDQNIDAILCPKLTTNNIVVVKTRTSAWEITLVSFYFEPDQNIGPHLDHLRKVIKELGHRAIIVGGDTNAKSTWWGNRKNDNRGQEMVNALDEMGLQVLNEGEIPTFDTIRGNKRYTSYVDVTACSEDLLNRVEEWKVDEGVTSSDHNTIKFKIRSEKAKAITINRTTRIFNTKKAKWSEFSEKLVNLMQQNNINKKEIELIHNKTELDKITEKYTNTIVKVCYETIPTKKVIEKYNLPWWNEELATLKQEVVTKKRRIRCAAPIRRGKVIEEYLQSKETYENSAKKAQIESWKSFCEKQDREGLWEGIYRVIGRTKRRQEDLPLVKDGKAYDPKESAAMLAEIFYPEDREDEDNLEHRRTRDLAKQVNVFSQNEPLDPPFTSVEVKSVIDSFNPKKAPGSDGLTADICKYAITWSLEMYLTLANKCLEISHFPTIWKEATVVVLQKQGREDYTNPKSYRPIGLLPVLGKILEKLIVNRVKWHILPGLSTRQYGFMPQKSTEDSLYDLMQQIYDKLKHKKLITMISLDIEGAFDSAWWPAIRLRLAEKNCPVNIRRVIDSYLQDRKVRVRYAGTEHEKATSKGCVQGSIGGAYSLEFAS
ncbi:jg8977 [Pararge aegeria aegeria]|uniref:Jg8977 protein n=1 Tax=Pararge aegeria aegeria TaxID=348720 RepID=A0A8S4QZY2_9NEOP|nr:jg8977 [Pararge aegeria aegeria]